jgi:hypothetical protein
LATGVFALKKAVQFAAIAFSAEPPAAGAADDAAEDGAADVAALVGDELGAEPVPLLPHAATQALSAPTRRIRPTFI